MGLSPSLRVAPTTHRHHLRNATLSNLSRSPPATLAFLSWAPTGLGACLPTGHLGSSSIPRLLISAHLSTAA